LLLLVYLIKAIYWLLNLLSILIVVRALISWLPLSEDNKFNSILITMTEPVMAPIRKLLSKIKFMNELPVDFSPMVAIFVLWIICGLLTLL
jgi:YggT family protein